MRYSEDMTKPSAPRSGPVEPPGLRASDNVRAETARRGVSFAELRRRIDMNRSTWDRRMTSPQSWRLGELALIARELDVPLETLADGIDQ